METLRQIKICGIKSKYDIDAAVKAGADMLGFVFFKPSPRSLKISHAVKLMEAVPANILKVALTVNANDNLLEKIATQTSANFLQFHGSEPPSRLEQVKKRFQLGIINALPVSNKMDLNNAKGFESIVDYLMFDAKPPQGATRPGGNAKSFDWYLLKDYEYSVPWILAGGLRPDNVQKAMRMSGASFVDVSSGVESTLGRKDIRKMKAFVKAVKEV